jgi:hypothetical protein
VGPATRFYHHPTSLPQPLALQRIQPPVHQVLQPPDLVPSAPGNSNDPTTTGPRSPSAKAATGTSKDPATTYLPLALQRIQQQPGVYHRTTENWHFKGFSKRQPAMCYVSPPDLIRSEVLRSPPNHISSATGASKDPGSRVQDSGSQVGAGGRGRSPLGYSIKLYVCHIYIYILFFRIAESKELQAPTTQSVIELPKEDSVYHDRHDRNGNREPVSEEVSTAHMCEL